MIWFLFLFFISHASRYPLLIPEIKSKMDHFFSDEDCTHKIVQLGCSDAQKIKSVPETYGFSFDCTKLNEASFFEKPKIFADVVCLNSYFDSSIQIQNDTYNIKGCFALSYWRNLYAWMHGCFRNIKYTCLYCWDAYCDDSYLYAAIATNHYITFLSASNIFGFYAQREIFSYYHDDEINQSQSLCFHNRNDQKIVSLISQNFMKVFSLDSKRLTDFIFCPLFDVFKHEYLGGGIYLLLADYRLYFAEIKNNQLYYYKQTIKDKNGKEMFIGNFAVNHEYKTDSARARFFVVMANNQLFLFDLLERYKNGVLSMQKLSNSYYMQEDKLSFVKDNIFSLNSDKYASCITLPSFWAVKKMFANERFSKSEGNNGNQKNSFWKKIYNFLYEQKCFILPWFLSSYYISYCYCHNSKFLWSLFMTYYLNIFIWLILNMIFSDIMAPPSLRQKVYLPFLPLLKTIHYIRYGVWS